MYWFTLAGRDQSHLSASTISLEDHLLLKASLRMHVVVNFPHDPFRPLNRSSDHRIGSRTPLRSTKQVVSGFQVPRHEDSGNNRQHAFAALVHVKELIIFAFCSPTYQPAILARDQPTLRVFRGLAGSCKTRKSLCVWPDRTLTRKRSMVRIHSGLPSF